MTLISIGELNLCPYCKEELESIPSRKKKCPHCEKYIYVRTRPIDGRQVLIRENQLKDIEQEWKKYYEEKEWKQLLLDANFLKEKQRFNKETGRDPTLTELKLRVANKQAKAFAANRQWGLYRNCKLDIAQTLEREANLKDALSSIFEVCYLDINGANNVMTIDGKAMPYAESERSGIKDFDPRMAFFAPAVIDWIRKWISVLNLSELSAKALFIEVNEKNRPFNKMPVSPEEAWRELKKRIEEDKRIDAIDTSSQGNVIREIEESIKQNKMDNAKKLLLKLRSLYQRKGYQIENEEEAKSFVEKLMVSENNNLSHQGETLMVSLVKKDESHFASLAKYYVKLAQANFDQHVQSHTIGQLASIDIELVRPLIPALKEAIRNHEEWNSRRFAAFNLGAIGEKRPEIIEDIVPILISYIKSPFEISKPESEKIEIEGITLTFSFSDGVDPTQWLKDAYIDTLGMFAKGDRKLILPYRSLFETLAKKDKSEYTRKKHRQFLKFWTAK